MERGWGLEIQAARQAAGGMELLELIVKLAVGLMYGKEQPVRLMPDLNAQHQHGPEDDCRESYQNDSHRPACRRAGPVAQPCARSPEKDRQEDDRKRQKQYFNGIDDCGGQPIITTAANARCVNCRISGVISDLMHAEFLCGRTKWGLPHFS